MEAAQGILFALVLAAHLGLLCMALTRSAQAEKSARRQRRAEALELPQLVVDPP